MRPRNMEPPLSPLDIVFGNEDAEQKQEEQTTLMQMDNTRSSIDQPGSSLSGAPEGGFGSGVTPPPVGVGTHNGDYLAQTEVSSNAEAQSTSHDGQTEGEKESDTGASAHDSAPASQDESDGTSGSGASQGVETGPQHDSGSSPNGENGDDRNEEPQR